MSVFKILAGFAIIAVVLVLWYRIGRSLRGGGSSGLDMTPQRAPRKSRKGAAGGNELERFIAQHHDRLLKLPAESAGTAAAPPALTPEPAELTAQPPSPAPPTAALLQAPFLLEGAEKLVFLAFKTALPDHHVLACVPLHQLLPGQTLEAGIAAHAHSVVVCRSDLSVYAAVDVTDPATAAQLSAVRQTLETRAIRHVVLDRQKLPRPKEIRVLLHL